MPIATCPSAWRVAVEHDHRLADTDHAAARESPIAPYRALAQARVAELLDGVEIRMRLWPSDLEGWLRSGVFETMHGEGTTSGGLNAAERISVEEKVLGVPANAAEADRPRFGYARGSLESYSAINDYGKVVVRFVDEIRSWANVVLGDSVGSTNIGGWPSTAPERLASPGLACRFSERDVLTATTVGEACDPAYRYAEVQIYGELLPEHIAEVLFCSGEPAPDDLRRLIDDWSLVFDEIESYPS